MGSESGSEVEYGSVNVNKEGTAPRFPDSGLNLQVLLKYGMLSTFSSILKPRNVATVTDDCKMEDLAVNTSARAKH